MWASFEARERETGRTCESAEDATTAITGPGRESSQSPCGVMDGFFICRALACCSN